MQTQVSLSSGNFKVLGSVRGSAESKFAFWISTDSMDLLTRARESMYASANVYGFSKAIINITTDYSRSGFFPIVYFDKVTMSGEVISFSPERSSAPTSSDTGNH
jgi:hypothetical protein